VDRRTGSLHQDADGATRRISARTVVWAAGDRVRVAGQLAEFTGAEEDRARRVTVEADLTLPGHLEVFALGDMVRVRGRDGTAITFPGVAPVASQQGRYAAKAVRARLKDRAAPPFRSPTQSGSRSCAAFTCGSRRSSSRTSSSSPRRVRRKRHLPAHGN
jgi:NADH dehydrogenase FAD-containing subunit